MDIFIFDCTSCDNLWQDTPKRGDHCEETKVRRFSAGEGRARSPGTPRWSSHTPRARGAHVTLVTSMHTPDDSCSDHAMSNNLKGQLRGSVGSVFDDWRGWRAMGPVEGSPQHSVHDQTLQQQQQQQQRRSCWLSAGHIPRRGSVTEDGAKVERTAMLIMQRSAKAQYKRQLRVVGSQFEDRHLT